jgi:hypothetical protein
MCLIIVKKPSEERSQQAVHRTPEHYTRAGNFRNAVATKSFQFKWPTSHSD